MRFADFYRALRRGPNRPGRWRIALAMALFLVGLPVDHAQAKYASLVLDAKTGEVLYARKADVQRYPASLTKMMTLYMVFEALDEGRLTLNQSLHVSRRAAGMPPSKLGLRRGNSIKVKDAILALVTKSANDVAVVVAEALGKTESQFAQMMTRKAWELGLAKTRFRNASGLPNKGQVTTARDMAKLARALLRHYPGYYKYFSTKSFTYKGRTYRNHNRLLKTYKGTDGIKTGYIRASGFNLVASTVRNGRRLIAVVFGGKSGRSRNRHMAKLLDKGFATIRTAEVRKVPPVPNAKPGVRTSVAVAALPEIAVEKLEPVRKEAAAPAYQFNPVVPAPKPQVVASASPPAKTEAVVVPQAKPKMPAKTPAKTASGKLAKPFGVQVGAYYKYVKAERAATKAARHAPDVLKGAHIWIPQRNGNRRKIFQSRLMGLSKSEARSACAQLKQARVDCMIIRLQKGISTAFLGPKVGEAIAN